MFKSKEHTVLYTTDVEMFRPTTTNRNLDMSRVKEIAKSMSEEGLLLVPITVNKKKQVIDGEHRLEAAKIAGKGIYYLMANNYGEKEMIQMNRNNKSWAMKNYIEHYAKGGNKHYQKLMDFRDMFPKIALSNSIYFLQNGSKTMRSVKEGDFKVVSYNRGVRWGEFIMELANVSNINNSFRYDHTIFIRTMVSVLKKYEGKGFEMNEFLDRAFKYPQLFSLCGDTETYSRMIEKIYNHNRRGDKKIFIRI
jgi:hypothetical protein|tara:strand:- start:2759 stop:3508 length:750 start_codon:yes stop_codon:yes gene_type:complete